MASALLLVRIEAHSSTLDGGRCDPRRECSRLDSRAGQLKDLHLEACADSQKDLHLEAYAEGPPA